MWKCTKSEYAAYAIFSIHVIDLKSHKILYINVYLYVNIYIIVIFLENNIWIELFDISTK